jgi:hypothetical protein
VRTRLTTLELRLRRLRRDRVAVTRDRRGLIVDLFGVHVSLSPTEIVASFGPVAQPGMWPLANCMRSMPFNPRHPDRYYDWALSTHGMTNRGFDAPASENAII